MKYITVFTFGFRPLKDHLLGLLISIKKERNYKMVIFSDSKDIEILKAIKKINNDKILLIKKNNPFLIFRYCLNSDLIFGKPKGIKKLVPLLTQLFNRKSYRVILPAGIVFKAIGYFKKERGISHFLNLYVRNYFVNNLFKFIVLTPTNEYMIYMAAAFSYPVHTLLNYPLPKNIYLSSKINKKSNKKSNKKIILFSPTHRWGEVLSPIEELLCNRRFVLSLKEKGFEIRYTLHPFEKQKVKFCNEVNLFDSRWDDVFSLVTDYSSIGFDYLSSGGVNLIYYIPDIKKFEKNEGIGPLYKSHINQNYKVDSLKDLIKILFSLENKSPSENCNTMINSNNGVDLNLARKDYFYNLYNILNEA